MYKEEIIVEIKRLAVENHGQALGWQAFSKKTGIGKSEWYPHLWLRWGDAIVEAGLTPNKFQAKIADDFLIEKYIDLIQELKKIPISGELKRKAKEDKTFPSHTVFERFGGKPALIKAVALYCQDKPEFEDVLSLCEELERLPINVLKVDRKSEVKEATAFVYLMKSGRYYKIGRTKSIGRRASELAIKIPIPPKTIHSIETDDPVGVEAYWHRRFSEKRGEGEWFDLSPEDVKAFKRWKRII